MINVNNALEPFDMLKILENIEVRSPFAAHYSFFSARNVRPLFSAKPRKANPMRERCCSGFNRSLQCNHILH